MDPPIPQIPTHLRNKHINLLLPPPQPACQQRQTEPLQPFQNIRQVPEPQLLHVRVLGPRVGRPHEHASLDVDEARRRHLRRVVVGGVAAHGPPERAGRKAEELAPEQDVGAVGGVVGGFDGQAVVLQLEPAAWFQVSEGWSGM